MKKISLLAFLLTLLNAANAQSTWSGSVAKILYENCTTCHHPGGIGPFSLMTYQDAFNYRFSMNYSVGVRSMPPWTPDPAYKNFAHERVLSQAQITEIQNWVAAGAPSGDLRFAPPAPVYGNSDEIQNPNLSLRIPTYTVSSNNDEYRNFVLPSGLTAAQYATAIEVIPGNRSIVHHVLVFQDSTNNAISPTSAGGTGSSASQLVYGYTPGAQAYYTPVGAGIRMPANTRVILQIHYAPGSLGLVDSTRINFKLSAGPMRNIRVDPLLNHFTSLTNGPLSIPANTTRTFNEATPNFTNNTFLYAFPHMHLVGRSIKSFATNAANDTIRFVNIPEWDFNWQDNFVFPNTVRVPTGYTLRAVATYDNTSNNPFNPSTPPQNVAAGESTTDEMMMVFFAYMTYQAGDENIIVDKRILVRGNPTFCQGQSVLLKTISGTGYTYQWKLNGTNIPGATSSSYYATQSGNYTVQINLGPNTATSDPVSVTVNPVPIATVTPAGTTNIPTGGSVTLTASTGTGYSYNWYRNDTLIVGSNSNTYTTNVPGSYYVEVYNGCYAISTPTVLTSTACAISANTSTVNAVCTAANGSATVTVSGGTAPLTYSWSNGANTAMLSNVAAGNYSVTIVDANSCSVVRTVTISATNTTIAATSSTTNAACNSSNGSASVTPSNGTAPYFYNWNNGAATQSNSNLAAGTYSVTVTDANGCVGSVSGIVVNNPTGPSTSLSANNAICSSANGSATATVSGGTAPYSYAWSNGSNGSSLTNVVAGTYSVTVTDANNCRSVSTVNVSSTNTVIIAGSSSTGTSCGTNNGTATVNATNGTAPYQYNWNNGAATQTNSNLAAGSYSVTITDANGCIGSVSNIIVTNPNAPSASVNNSTNVSCFGGNNGAATLSVSGGTAPYSYNWSNGANASAASNLSAGTYTVTVTDAASCVAIATVQISQPTAISINLTTQTSSNVNCFGGNNGVATVAVSGGTFPYSYNWSNGANGSSASNLTAGTYTLTVTDANNCVSTFNTQITQPAAALAVSGITTAASAAGAADGSVQTTVSGGTSPYNYNWSNGQSSANLSAVVAGNYSVTVSDANGCTQVQSFNVADGPTAVNIQTSNISVNLYPNPTSSNATLLVNLNRSIDLRIDVINQLGQVVKTVLDAAVINGQYTIDSAEWPAGVYYIRISAGNETAGERLLVK